MKQNIRHKQSQIRLSDFAIIRDQRDRWITLINPKLNKPLIKDLAPKTYFNKVFMRPVRAQSSSFTLDSGRKRTNFDMNIYPGRKIDSESRQIIRKSMERKKKEDYDLDEFEPEDTVKSSPIKIKQH